MEYKESVIIKGEQAFNEIRGIEGIESKVSNDTPVALVINGKGILHKKIPSNNLSKKSILQQLLRTNKIEDFEVQQFPLNPQFQLVSIIRKELLSSILSFFQKLGFYVLSVSLGPFLLKNIFPLLPNPINPILEIPNFRFYIEGRQLTDFEVSSTSIDSTKIWEVGDFKIQEEQLLAFSTALQFIIHQGGNLKLSSISANQKEWKQKRLFKGLMWSVLVTLLIVLIFNFVIFSHFSQQNQYLQSLSSQHQTAIGQIEELQKQIANNQKFIQQTGNIQPSKTSFYADELARSLGSDIQLTNLTINPLVVSKKKSEPLTFQQKTIEVKGNCKKSSEFNNWLNELKTLDWIEEVETKEFSQKGNTINYHITINVNK